MPMGFLLSDRNFHTTINNPEWSEQIFKGTTEAQHLKKRAL